MQNKFYIPALLHKLDFRHEVIADQLSSVTQAIFRISFIKSWMLKRFVHFILLIKMGSRIYIYGVFFSTKKNVYFISKNAILRLFLKNVSPSKRLVCFILNNLHFPMVEGIAFYALHKSRVVIIPCKADDFCLFIRLPDEIDKILKLIFSLFCEITLRKH